MIVAVGNHKGGVGKTMLARNLAAAWARRRQRIALVDVTPRGAPRRGSRTSLRRVLEVDAMDVWGVPDRGPWETRWVQFADEAFTDHMLAQSPSDRKVCTAEELAAAMTEPPGI